MIVETHHIFHKYEIIIMKIESFSYSIFRMRVWEKFSKLLHVFSDQIFSQNYASNKAKIIYDMHISKNILYHESLHFIK